MANEAWVFSLTTTELAAGNVASTAGGDFVDVAEANAAAVPASIDVGLYVLKAEFAPTGAFDAATANGRDRLLRCIEQIKAQIQKGVWPPVARSL